MDNERVYLCVLQCTPEKVKHIYTVLGSFDSIDDAYNHHFIFSSSLAWSMMTQKDQNLFLFVGTEANLKDGGYL